ncbi:unnamed protein product [Blepharisma stoltei]|uniref:ADP-ribosylation factor-like protein n=1 Tax=Blepharisma stoltei TaxID=1481888 RepID=A0AAU9J5K4_9CILI|nr:unnamed protein product [Blepharisma stoltei]
MFQDLGTSNGHRNISYLLTKLFQSHIFIDSAACKGNSSVLSTSILFSCFHFDIMSLLSSLRGFKKSDCESKILILGFDNAGKTTILQFLSGEEIRNNFTPGFNLQSLTNENFRFLAWGIDGRENMRPIWRNYFDHADGLIFVIDSVDRNRMQEIGQELQYLFEDDKLAGIPVLIFANKQDFLRALSAIEISNALMLHSIRDRDWCIIPSCSRTGEGLQEGMKWLVQTIQK